VDGPLTSDGRGLRDLPCERAFARRIVRARPTRLLASDDAPRLELDALRPVDLPLGADDGGDVLELDSVVVIDALPVQAVVGLAPVLGDGELRVVRGDARLTGVLVLKLPAL